MLDQEVLKRNTKSELSRSKPDPLWVAQDYNDEFIALICALFAYGRADLIVKFLQKLDFSLLGMPDETIKKELQSVYYRFQNSDDIIAFFIGMKRLKNQESLEVIFKKGYHQKGEVLEGISTLIASVLNSCDYHSSGFSFLVGTPLCKNKNGVFKTVGISPMKRWNMYLRWMIRKDELDLGLWSGVDKKDLILPLDTHTFKVSKSLGLLSRDAYDLKSALMISEKLKEFDPSDPIKYDFALYRIGQEQIKL